MKIVSLVFPGFTLIDVAAPMQALSKLPGAEVQYVWKERGLLHSDAGLSVEATHLFDDAAEDANILFVPGAVSR